MDSKVFTDAVNENAEHHCGDKHIEEDTQLDDQWHAVSERNCRKEEAVFERQQSQHLR